jgi:hypothetical protein
LAAGFTDSGEKSRRLGCVSSAENWGRRRGVAGANEGVSSGRLVIREERGEGDGVRCGSSIQRKKGWTFGEETSDAWGPPVSEGGKKERDTGSVRVVGPLLLGQTGLLWFVSTFPFFSSFLLFFFVFLFSFYLLQYDFKPSQTNV